MFYPAYHFKRIQQIPLDFLEKNNIRYLILDVDNTLTTHEHPTPSAGVKEWLEKLQNADIKPIILSNNNYKRVKPFADILGLPFVCCAKKPFTSGFEKCRLHYNCTKNKMAVIGDQLLTDVWGGNRYGIVTILVDPIEPETFFLFRIKRWIEHKILSRYTKEGKAGYYMGEQK